MSALAVYTDRHHGEVAFHASSGRVVNFEPKAVTAGRARHAAQGGSLIEREGWVSIQRNLKRDSSRGGPKGEKERRRIVSLIREKKKVQLRNVGQRRHSLAGLLDFKHSLFFFGPSPDTAINIRHGGRSLHYTCQRRRVYLFKRLIGCMKIFTHTVCVVSVYFYSAMFRLFLVLQISH